MLLSQKLFSLLAESELYAAGELGVLRTFDLNWTPAAN